MTAALPRLLLTAALATALIFGLSACGRKGHPKPPDGQESEYTYPHDYPAPATVVPGGEADAEPDDGSGPLWLLNNDNRTTTKTY